MVFAAPICCLASSAGGRRPYHRHCRASRRRNSGCSSVNLTYHADVWLVSELPITELPSEFLSSLRRSNYLMVIEEHVCAGGFGQMLAHQLLLAGTAPGQFVHRTALGYVSGRYGSQRFHRAECGLDPASIVAELNRAVLA